MMNTEQLAKLIHNIRTVQAEPGTLLVITVPDQTATSQLLNISKTFEQIAVDSAYKFVIVPESIKVQMVPKDPNSKIEVTEK